MEILSEAKKLERMAILSRLREEPDTVQIQAYLETLRDGSPQWDIETFAEGARRLVDLCGCRRSEYYVSELNGLHYPTTFTELWNSRNPQHPVTIWDQDFRRPCPSSWSNTIQDNRWVLRYEGNGPLSQGLNELLRGPTTLDCGMFCQFLLWMAIRYLVGDDIFDNTFIFEHASFVLTQVWDQPLNKGGTEGNLLYQFYDTQSGETPAERSRIQTKTFYNHENYLAKHPGGMGFLHNVTQIDGFIHIFDPFAHHNILSEEELGQRLLQAYNAPRDLADVEKLQLYKLAPWYEHEDFAPKTFGDLVENAAKFTTHELSEHEWTQSQRQRKEAADGLCLTFNFEKLIKYLHQRCGAIDGTN